MLYNMGRQTSLTCDITGEKIPDGEDYYRVSFSKTVEQGKSFQKAENFYMSHKAFMTFIDKYGFKPEWQKVVKGDDGKWTVQDHG